MAAPITPSPHSSNLEMNSVSPHFQDKPICCCGVERWAYLEKDSLFLEELSADVHVHTSLERLSGGSCLNKLQHARTL